MTLVEFLLARIAEDEEAGREFGDDGTVGTWSHWALAECDAKRRIVELHQIEVSEVSLPPFDALTGEPNPPEFDVTCNVCGWASPVPSSACETLRLLALPYADHPDYRQEWRP